MPTSTQPAARKAPMPEPPRRERETARLLAALATGTDRLNFGCGDHPLPGWINLDNGDGEWYGAPQHPDVIALDIFEALGGEALPDACASFIYSEHLFEHFTLQQGHDILREWFRALKPGGTVRVVCPDLESEARLFLRQIAPAPDAPIDAHRARWLGDRCPLQPGERLTRAMVLNSAMRLDGHKFLYDFETLSQSLTLAGFDPVTRQRFGQSDYAALWGIDSHDGGDTGRSWVPSVALVVEARRPESSHPGCHGLAAALSGQPVPTVATPPSSSSHPRRSLVSPSSPPTALERAIAELSSLRVQHQQALELRERLRHRLIESVAERCVAAGYRRVALYGAGRHTLPITRQPWQWHDIRVAAILDDNPPPGPAPTLRGIPILRPADLPADIDAVVISSDAHEREIYQRAVQVLAPRRIPILRIYGDAPDIEPPETTRIRLVERWGLSDADARWLVANRAERHDATLPILPPQRTELHLRRYEFAAAHAKGRRVLDGACGTGYGSALLADQGAAASVIGIDIDERAIDYATRCHGLPAALSGKPVRHATVSFRCAEATGTRLPDSSIDLVVSFETIEHVPEPAALLAEFARVLSPGGALILSTPNDAGLTDHHVHSLTRESLEALLLPRFTDLQWFGQRADSAPMLGPPAAGINPIAPSSPTPECLIGIAQRR